MKNEFKWDDLRDNKVQIIKDNKTGKPYSVHRFIYTWIHNHKIAVVLLNLNKYSLQDIPTRFTEEEFKNKEWSLIFTK